MKSLTFALILIMSISVYAQTEAGLKPGFKTSKQKREIAASARNVDAGLVALANFNKTTAEPSRNNMGYVGSPFENKSGAFTRADSDKLKAEKKKAALPAASPKNNK